MRLKKEEAECAISDFSKYKPLFTETEGNKKYILKKQKEKKEQQSPRKPRLALRREEGGMPDACLEIYHCCLFKEHN